MSGGSTQHGPKPVQLLRRIAGWVYTRGLCRNGLDLRFERAGLLVTKLRLLCERTQHHFSQALGLGRFVARSLGNMTLRLDYTCALHESFDQNFLSGGDTTNVQEIKSPVMHRVMAGVLWKL